MVFKFGYIHVNRQGNISEIIISHYKYNTRATPGRSQLVYYIKESLFNYIYILAVPDPALLGFDYFPIYYILIIAIPDS